jgi:hypothetical protein
MPHARPGRYRATPQLRRIARDFLAPANSSGGAAEWPSRRNAPPITLRLLADWVRQLRTAFGLRLAAPAGLWAAIASGTGLGSIAISATWGGTRALMKLIELHQHFDALGRLAQLNLIMRVALDEGPPRIARELGELRRGVQAVIALQRRGRGRGRPPVAAPVIAAP